MNAALFEAGPRLEILPHKFNAQLKTAPGVARDAVLWHFYSSISGSALTSFEMLVERILRGERLCRDAIVEMMQRRHPWRRDSLLDDWMAIGLARSGRLDPGYKYWFQGHRIRACHFWTVHALRRGSARIRCFFQPYAVASKPHG